MVIFFFYSNITRNIHLCLCEKIKINLKQNQIFVAKQQNT